MSLASAAFSYLLIAIAVFLTAWGILGFAEYLFGFAPVMPLQNPTFPQGTQFIHWFAITSGGLVFLIGYVTRWEYTPYAMVAIYAVMAAICFIQTFDFMTNPGRYWAMVFEYIAYIAISIYLLKSERMQTHFGRMS